MKEFIETALYGIFGGAVASVVLVFLARRAIKEAIGKGLNL